MATNSSRVAVAVHVLAYLAWRPGQAAASEAVARSVNTNAVVVRRIVGALREAGLVTVQPGAGGGARLARDAAEITLLDVYRAVEGPESLFRMHAQPPSACCGVGSHIGGVLEGVFCNASRAAQDALAQVTVADVFREVRRRAVREPQPA
ncbi:MAG TPA: Rrf2 family transcriptional regulator [Longimicrobium sp.]|nr:Rrf2 family transcriptional regulator [Longimicrobium sp.]